MIEIWDGDTYIASVSQWRDGRWMPVGYPEATWHDSQDAAIEQARALRARRDQYWAAVATWESPEEQVVIR